MLIKALQIIVGCLLLLLHISSYADNLNIAVASNFAHTLDLLAKDFKSKTGHHARISRASTGKIYTQINHGAPFDIFMAADEYRPDLLIAENKATTELSKIYAIGRLVLISNIKPNKTCLDVLNSPRLKRLAIANPKTSPYGLAAQQTLEKLQHWKSIKNKLVMGGNIAQSLQFISTKNADAGFVAKSMLRQTTKIKPSCQWQVDASLHDPIKQKMIVLSKASNKPAVIAFWQYMQSDAAKKIIKNSGYDAP